jgi:pantothenate kinase
MQSVAAERRIIGIAGCPGSGKSWIAAALVAEHPKTHVAVPLDGFHLAQSELERLGRAARKGAPDTFDVDGYIALLRRIRSDVDRTVLAPRFDRHLEEPIANAIAVEPRHTTVITEGNYLLHDHGGWEQVRPLLDECWFVDSPESLRIARLTARHVEHGRTAREATDWVRDVDEPNARLVRASRPSADRVLHNDDEILPGDRPQTPDPDEYRRAP